MTGRCGGQPGCQLDTFAQKYFCNHFRRAEEVPVPVNLAQPFAPDNLNVTVEDMRNVCLLG